MKKIIKASTANEDISNRLTNTMRRAEFIEGVVVDIQQGKLDNLNDSTKIKVTRLVRDMYTIADQISDILYGI